MEFKFGDGNTFSGGASNGRGNGAFSEDFDGPGNGAFFGGGQAQSFFEEDTGSFFDSFFDGGAF